MGRESGRRIDLTMPRSRLFRFRDRGSYKSSEVVGLFVISIGLGMVFYLICLGLSWLCERFMG
jgi:hypothetical protein